MWDLEELKRIFKDLGLINSANVSYTTGRNRGLTDEEVERRANNAIWDAEDIIDRLIEELEDEEKKHDGK